MTVKATNILYDEVSQRMREHFVLIARNAHLAYLEYLKNEEFTEEEIDGLDEDFWESV